MATVAANGPYLLSKPDPNYLLCHAGRSPPHAAYAQTAECSQGCEHRTHARFVGPIQCDFNGVANVTCQISASFRFRDCTSFCKCFSYTPRTAFPRIPCSCTLFKRARKMYHELESETRRYCTTIRKGGAFCLVLQSRLLLPECPESRKFSGGRLLTLARKMALALAG